MKRVIAGRAYNTSTAARVASTTAEGAGAPFRSATLFLGRAGDYFIHYERASLLAEVSERGGAGADEALYLLRTPEELAEFRDKMMGYDWRIHDRRAWKRLEEMLSKPPGKRSKGSPVRDEAIVNLRLPRSLKERVAAAAELDGVSVNFWIMRRLESCLAEPQTQTQE